jgi:hypothetical protein
MTPHVASEIPHTERSDVRQAVLEIDPDALSPVEALMKFYELRRLAEAETGKSIRAVKTA